MNYVPDGQVAAGHAEFALFLIRVTVGAVMLAHGWNHFFGGGRLPGAARWFESLGMRPGLVHAWLASATEVGAGAGLLLGFATVLGCAATIGLMTVAGVVAHRKNGFFVFREGYEYVLVLAVAATAVAAGGPGRLAVDNVAGIEVSGVPGLLVAVVVGVGSAGALLACCYRPPPPA
jgi:putative oxidoreductase